MSDADAATIQGLLCRLRLAGEEKDAGDETDRRRRAAEAKAAEDDLFRLVYGRLEGMTRKSKRYFPGLEGREDTGDILNEAARRLCKKLRKNPPATVSDFFSDASRKIRDTLIELLRQSLRTPRPVAGAGLEGEGSPLADKGTDTHDPALVEELTEFHRQVEKLPEAEREVFDLLWYQELTQPQAAELLGVCLRTVKLRWQYARVRLGKWLRS